MTTRTIITKSGGMWIQRGSWDNTKISALRIGTNSEILIKSCRFWIKITYIMTIFFFLPWKHDYKIGIFLLIYFAKTLELLRGTLEKVATVTYIVWKPLVFSCVFYHCKNQFSYVSYKKIWFQKGLTIK